VKWWTKTAVIAVALVGMVGLALPQSSKADRSYRVRRGDNPARIAQRHHVSVGNLLAANRLSRGDQLREGQELVIPDRGVHYVQPGETLSEIARDHEVAASALARANRIRQTASLRVGQRLVLPGHEAHRDREEAADRWGRPRRPGVADFLRVRSEDLVRIRLVDARGRTRRAAVRRLAPLMRSRTSGETRAPHRRLLSILARISDHFGGRTVYIISGFRSAGGFTRTTSKHTAGRAIDIRLRGVPNRELRDYARSLDRVGVGFYPRSSFVHVDVREESAYWVDDSRPGQRPTYRARAERTDQPAATTGAPTTGGETNSEPTAGAVSDDPAAAETASGAPPEAAVRPPSTEPTTP